jgi:predicted GH43/DUF377 family glycosyl hydrolase
MKWEKRGLIYGPDGSSGWARHSALQPTPLLREAQGYIRVFVGMRDSEGVGRIGFLDVSAENPSKVLRVSNSPVLDIGGPGAFDDNGVIPSAIVERDGRLYLFYAGYQLVRKVKFLAFGGVAISDDDGETFTRYSRAPICDRTNDEVCFRVIHTMMFDDGGWRAWYGGGDSFEVEHDKQYPRYNVRHAESPDGIHLSEDYQVCIDMSDAEHRVGRPYVIKDGSLYRMFYGAGTKENGYRLGYADSMNGVDWTRKDREIGIDISASGWDSQMQAFPSVVRYDAQTFLFYNGNDYGSEGFGYAVLEHW